MAASTEIRSALVSALEADLVGPFPGGEHEVLPIAPSRWYLTGFLAPQRGRDSDNPDDADEFAGGTEEDEDETPQEPEPKQKATYPASMGMSVLLPAASDKAKDQVAVTVSFADYIKETVADEDSGKKSKGWRRVPQPPRTVSLPLDAKAVEQGVALPDTPGILVCGKLEPADAPGLPSGARALSVFVVNQRTPEEERGRADEQFIFQVSLEVAYESGFLARPNRTREASSDTDDETADLQFRDHFEWAVGHGAAVQVPAHGGGSPRQLRTTWIPRCEVRKVETHEEPNVVTSMEDLATMGADALAKALAPLPEAYARFIAQQAEISLDSPARKERRKLLLKNATRANARIAAGIALLSQDSVAREAFQQMNLAMATAARKRSPHRYTDKKPSWRLFQLAFVLLNLVGIADEAHPDREEVELIFFPTGGGKTEAYLGAIGFTLLLRRLRGQERPDKGLGVAVLLRYTLRLLTLDQLGRAATLVCALELLRQKDPARLGDVRFSVGLWVGRSASANTMEQLKKLVIDYKNSSAKNPSSPFPLASCPWCGGLLGKDSLVLGPKVSSPEEIVVSCVSPPGQPPSLCEFAPRNNREGLPVLFVDEQIYRELPCFIIATVDKFAMLPWRGETGMLFGRVSHREGKKAYGPMDRAPKSATLVPGGFRPPELVVQDELHLISGPLGTMVGLYETAIEWLSCRTVNGKAIKPKIIASTATVRRAQRQVASLFGRPSMSLFPPPAVNASETFFAKVDANNSRLYVGVAAPGKPLKAILLRTYVALLAAAQRQYASDGTSEAADAYMTLAGYFNSLRELGGMRRLVEDDVFTRAAAIEKRRPLNLTGAHWGKDRVIKAPVELTSREKAGAIKEAKDQLGQAHSTPEHVDVLLASNMISVGVDIDRLGLMVVAGQPKTTSEYIQATSRVGRDDKRPGLVVTCFNVRRPRDRSHYERFVAYHESFYRHVEATSLTPFSGPALERGLAGTLLSMARLGDSAMTPPTAAMDIEAHQKLVMACVEVLARRGGDQAQDSEDYEQMTESLRQRGKKIIDAWTTVVRAAREGAGARQYSKLDHDKSAGKPMLHTVTDEERPERNTPDARFVAPMSMRDVESTVHLWIERRSLGGARR